MSLAQLGNGFLQQEQPWVLVKSNRARCDTVVNIAVNFVNMLATLSEPYMPSLSRRILAQLNLTALSPLRGAFLLLLVCV